MQAFVDWVLARRHRSLMLTVLLTPVPPAAAALITVETVLRGPAQGVVNAVAALIAAALIEHFAEGQPGALTRLTLVSFAFAVGAGVLLQQMRSLTLAFQGLVLFCFLGAALLSFGSGPGGWLFGPVLEQLQELLRQSGANEAQLELVRAQSVPLLLAVLFAQVVGGLFLAYWWISLAAKEPRFGAEFRRLALGKVLGLVASAVVTVGLVFDASLIQNLSSLALIGFLFQGFAVLHAWAHAKRWHAAFVAPVYVLLVTPLMVAVVLALSAVGLIDNWFNLRAPLHAQS